MSPDKGGVGDNVEEKKNAKQPMPKQCESSSSEGSKTSIASSPGPVERRPTATAHTMPFMGIELALIRAAEHAFSKLATKLAFQTRPVFPLELLDSA